MKIIFNSLIFYSSIVINISLDLKKYHSVWGLVVSMNPIFSSFYSFPRILGRVRHLMNLSAILFVYLASATDITCLKYNIDV